MKIIDLSIPIEDGLPSDPRSRFPRFSIATTRTPRSRWLASLKGCTVEDLPEGNGWGIEFLQVCTTPEPMWMPPTTITPP